MEVSCAQLQRVIDLYPEPEQPKVNRTYTGNSQRLDVEAYLGKYGIERTRTKDHKGSTLYLLKHCIFDPSHEDESAIGQTPEGKLFYQCFHNSCQNRTWKEARQAISGDEPLFSRYPHSNKEQWKVSEQRADAGRKAEFHFISLTEYMAGDLQPPQWRIKNILEDESLAVLFGPAESYKSFLAIDWGLSIAAQIPWNGHYVKGGLVFSIIGEGKNGYRRRIAAWLKANNVSKDFPFFVSDVPAQILNVESAQAVGNAINELRAEHGKPALVIIDTLARNFGPGHENDTKDMTTFISNLDEHIGRDFARLIVHHTGLSDQNRSRGNSALRAALDAEYKMSSKEGEIILCCTKMKDAPKFQPFHFMPKVIALGGTEQDPITSVVLSQVEGQQATVKLTTQWKDALNLLHKMCEGKVSESLSEWRKALYEKKIYTRGASYSACDTLSDKGLIVISGDYVRLSELSERVLFDLPGQGVDVSVLSSPLIRGGQSDTPRTKQQTTVII